MMLQQHAHTATSCRAASSGAQQQLQRARQTPPQRAARLRAHAQPQQQGSTKQQQQGSTKQQQQQQQSGAAGTPPEYEYSDGVNRFLGNFLPDSRAAAGALSTDFAAPKLTGLSLTEMAAAVEAGLAASQWFVTGEVDARLFSERFVFKDESVATTGIESYATGVRKLFDQATSKVELICVTPRPETRAIEVVWRLEGRVNLPFKPCIKPYVVITTLGVEDGTGLIRSQLDEFTVPGWDLLLSTLLGGWFGAPPAPPVEQLREAAAAGRLESLLPVQPKK